MKNLLVLHGSYSDPSKNWYQYIGRKAKEMGYRVTIPKLEHIDKLNLEETYASLLKNNYIDTETTLLGHSSGATYILGILQRLPKELVVQKALLVACFVDANLTKELFQEVPKIHYQKLFPSKWNWKKIRKNCARFIIVQSSDDPYVQMRHAKILKEKLGGKLVIIPKGRHFSVNSGGERFKEFPELLKFL